MSAACASGSPRRAGGTGSPAPRSAVPDPPRVHPPALARPGVVHHLRGERRASRRGPRRGTRDDLPGPLAGPAPLIGPPPRTTRRPTLRPESSQGTLRARSRTSPVLALLAPAGHGARRARRPWAGQRVLARRRAQALRRAGGALGGPAAVTAGGRRVLTDARGRRGGTPATVPAPPPASVLALDGRMTGSAAGAGFTVTSHHTPIPAAVPPVHAVGGCPCRQHRTT